MHHSKSSPDIQATGEYYVARYHWDSTKWALYSPGGVVVYLGTKTECTEEMQRCLKKEHA